MKNLFKNLMLVAVAAMAFTACTETNDEVNAVAKKTVINGIATIENDDTRSGFVGSTTDEDGKASYQSAWDGGENLKLFINYGAAEATATVDAEGKFTIELDGDYSNCTVTACSPAEAWSSEYSFTIPAEQTPRETSVDPAAHILKAQAISVTNGVGEFKMQHEVSYGKMTVNTPADFEIAKVVINLKGAWYGYDKDLTYTLNAANVKNNTFWFATDTIEVSEMTVTAYDADDNAYTKTITMDENKVLKFQYYKVSTFSVSNLEKYEAPAAPAFLFASADGTSGDRYVTFTSTELGTLKLNAYNCFQNSQWPVGTYTFGTSYGQIYTSTYSTYNGTALYGGEVVVSVVNGLYHIEIFNLLDINSNVVLEHATYTGNISPLEVPDPREALATPVLTSAVTGDKIATISWNAVEGAAGYKVACNCGIDTTTTETSIELTFPEYGYHCVFVTTLAPEGDANYKNSETASVELNFKDSNVLADYIWDQTFVWDNDSFKLTDDNYSSAYWRIYLNEADRPGNNSIKEGTYTCSVNNTSPAQGQFCIKIYGGWSNIESIYAGNTYADDTLEVKVVDGEYQIVYTHGAKSHGYKGRPSGFVLPGEGGDNGDSGDNGDNGDVDNTQYGDGTQANPYVYTCNVVKSGGYYRLTFTSQSAGAQPLYLESYNDLANSFNVGAITIANNWYPNYCKYAEGTVTVSWDESTISFTNVEGTIYSFDEIKISTFNGYVYYKCDSVNLY